MEPKRRGILFWICATVLTLLWVSPIIASFFTSVKTLDELNQGLFWTLPETFAWHNYYDVFISGGFAKYFINTFILTILNHLCKYYIRHNIESYLAFFTK